MRQLRLRKVLTGVALCMALDAKATDFMYVNDMSRLKWQMVNGTVYFRNLNDFDPTFLGCCYSYWLDTNASGGKAAWASMLLKIASGQGLWIAVDNKGVPGLVTYLGVW